MAHDRRERARRREVVLAVPRVRGQLVEQRARVERVPARVRLEPLDGARRQPHAAGLCQRAQLVGGERRQAEPAALGSRGGLDQALGQDRRALARRHHDQHPVRDEPAEHEQQRAQRRHVRPVGVVDEEHDRVLVLQGPEQLEDARAGPDVVRALRRQARAALSRAAQELVDHAEAQVALRLLAARAQHGDVADVGEEPLRQRGLPDAGRPFDEHQPGPARARVLEPFRQGVELPLPADEDRPRGRCLRTASESPWSRGCLYPDPPYGKPLEMGIPLTRTRHGRPTLSAHARRSLGPVRRAAARVLARAAVVVERRHA